MCWPKNEPFRVKKGPKWGFRPFSCSKCKLYLGPDSGQSAEKKFAGPKMGHLGPKRGQNEVLGHFLAQNASVFGDFAYYGCE